jgi:ABC-type polysaccharide/polyol phosphate transport system ATPase subunit
MHETISVKKLGKKYRVYFEKPALIKNILPFFISQGKPVQFWALRDVSFTLREGECIGIVGPNGSGKSTLLSVLAGVTEPTEGDVLTRGKVSSLLSLGAGFNFELTGQENVYLNGIILGLSKAQIDAIYDDIVEFADLGKFMNAKLSTYSAGMNMRLGFSIAIMAPFDTLLIDEILTVGDLKFQTKCFKIMEQFYKNKKKTIVFVSHELEKIEELCTKVIWFEHGRIEQMGEPSEVLPVYRKRYRDKYMRRGERRARGPSKRAKKAEISVDFERISREIPSTLFGSNICWAIASGLLCEGRYRSSPHPYWLKELGKLRLGILRYPGNREGNFFNWKAALGKRRKKQPFGYPSSHWIRKIRGKTELVPMSEPKDMVRAIPYFGPDEFNRLAEKVGAEKILVLNVLHGTPEDGVGFLRHMDSIGRAVSFVELGHELYYDDFHEIGVTFPLTPEEYASKVKEFSKALRSYRKDIGIIAAGGIDSGTFTRNRYQDWVEKLLTISGEWIDYIAIHNTEVPIFNLTGAYKKPPDSTSYEALMAAPYYVSDNLETVKRILSTYQERTGRIIKIAMTFYRTHFEAIPRNIHGVHRVTRRENPERNKARNRSLGSALYEAMLLNLFLREERVDIATRSLLFHGVDSALWHVSREGVCRNPQ